MFDYCKGFSRQIGHVTPCCVWIRRGSLRCFYVHVTFDIFKYYFVVAFCHIYLSTRRVNVFSGERCEFIVIIAYSFFIYFFFFCIQYLSVVISNHANTYVLH